MAEPEAGAVWFRAYLEAPLQSVVELLANEKPAALDAGQATLVIRRVTGLRLGRGGQAMPAVETPGAHLEAGVVLVEQVLAASHTQRQDARPDGGDHDEFRRSGG